MVEYIGENDGFDGSGDGVPIEFIRPVFPKA